MKSSMFRLIGIITFSVFSIVSFSQEDPRSTNPNNSNASVSLSWLNDIARLRIGGVGVGASNGFEIQGPSNKRLLKIVDGSTSVYNPNNQNASVSLSWLNNTARLRIGGVGVGASNGFEIQGPSNKRLLKIVDGSTSVYNPNNQNASVSLSWLNNTARLRIGGVGVGASNGFEIQRSGNMVLMKVLHNGNVGIGTTTPKYKLDVKGTIRSEEVIVETGWSDFVFEPTYHLISLEDLEQYIKQNKRLPDVPSAEEVKENGLNLGQSDAILLQKIEELTLYLIEQNKRLNKVEVENKKLKEKMKK